MTGKWNRTPASAPPVARPVSVPSGAGAAHEDPSRWWPRWSRLLEQQLEAWRRLDELSGTQHERVFAGDAEGALAVLGDRQPWVEQARRTAEEMSPLIERRADLTPRLAPADRARFESLVQEIATLSERVRERDGLDRAELERQRGLVAQELGGMARGRGVLAAYTGTPAPGASSAPRFQDRQG